jgi:hypothetical protein
MRRYLAACLGAYLLFSLVLSVISRVIDDPIDSPWWSPLGILGVVLYFAIYFGIPLLVLLVVAYLIVKPFGSPDGRSSRALGVVAAVAAVLFFAWSEGSDRFGGVGLVAVWAALALFFLRWKNTKHT